MGETREQRIAEFHEENTPPVVGLREGAWLLVDGPAVVLQGTNGARLFRRGEAPVELASGSRVDALV
jgi:dipeptidase E